MRKRKASNAMTHESNGSRGRRRSANSEQTEALLRAAAAHQSVVHARRDLDAAHKERREAFEHAVAIGVRNVEIAEILSLSPARVGQIMKR